MAMQISPSLAERNLVTDSFGMSKGERGKKLARYCDRVKAAKAHRESEGYDETWKRLRNIYRLKMLRPGDNDQIAVAIAFATINVIAPSVAVNYPKITVTGTREDLQDKATITETVVNYWWRANNIKPDFRSAVKDYLVYGHGWLKVGWRFVERERDLDDDEKDAEFGAARDELDAYAQDSPETAHELPTDDDVAQLLPDTTMETTEDAPFVERISPFDVFVDPEATCMQDAKWIAQRLVLPIETVKDDERYSGAARRKLNADGSLRWFNEDQSDIPPDAGRVTVWEYYDLIDEQVCVFAEQKDVGFLVSPTAFPYPYGHPFVQLRNYEVPDQFYPIGEIEAIEPLQDELNHTRSAMVLARKLDISKFLYRESAFDDQGLDALASSRPNTGVPVRDETPLQDAVAPFPHNDANAQLYTQHSETIESDIDRVTGVNEYQRGAMPEIRRTATEASLIQDAANARASDKLAQIEQAAAEVSKRLVMLAQTYMTTEQVAMVTGPNGATAWAPFTREDVTGEFNFEVEAGSTQPQNETFRRQQATQLMQTIAPFISTGFINVPAVLAKVLRDGFGVKNPEMYLQEPPPMLGPDGMPMDPMAQGGGRPPPQGEEPPPEASPQETGGPQPAPGPGVAPAGIEGVPPEILAQLQEQYQLLQGA